MQQAPKRARTEEPSGGAAAVAPSAAESAAPAAVAPAAAPSASQASWVGEWHVLASAKCYANECADPSHAPMAAFRIETLGDGDALLMCASFRFDQLVEPMGGMPFENYTCEDAFFSPTDESVELDFTAEGGCGIHDVRVGLQWAPVDGQMPVTAQLQWAVKVGYLYKKRGYNSWKGSRQVWIRKAA